MEKMKFFEQQYQTYAMLFSDPAMSDLIDIGEKVARQRGNLIVEYNPFPVNPDTRFISVKSRAGTLVSAFFSPVGQDFYGKMSFMVSVSRDPGLAQFLLEDIYDCIAYPLDYEVELENPYIRGTLSELTKLHVNIEKNYVMKDYSNLCKAILN